MSAATPSAGDVAVRPLPRLPVRVCIAALVLMVAAAGAAWLARPRLQAMTDAPNLDAQVPTAFGDWRMVPGGPPQVDVSQGVETVQEQPYDQTVMRTYVNRSGEQVMLALAWGERQRQDVKVHRPEVCYPAQGYAVRRLADGQPLPTAGRVEPVPTTELLAEFRGGGYEAVRYWIRVGNQYGGDGLATRWYILNEGFRGRIPDGILVRASQHLRNPSAEAPSQALMAAFLADLVAAMPDRARQMLVR